jgi:hypothetical protein
MPVEGGGWVWMVVDGYGWTWIDMDGSGWIWMDVDGSRCVSGWVEVFGLSLIHIQLWLDVDEDQ